MSYDAVKEFIIVDCQKYMKLPKETFIYQNFDEGNEAFIQPFKSLQNRKNEFFSYLTTYEKKILDQTPSIKRANEFLFGRGLLRYELSERIDVEPSKIDIKTTQYGKPYLNSDLPLDLYFNLSHSLEVIAIAFSKQSHVGFDIERIDDSLEFNSLAPIFMTEKELNTWGKNNSIDLFFTYWTQKEACLKCEGIGYLKEPREYNIGDFTSQKHSYLYSGTFDIDSQQFAYTLALKQKKK